METGIKPVFSFMPFYPEAEFTDEEIADFLDDFISAVLRPEKQ
jgi:hypothetical protein